MHVKSRYASSRLVDKNVYELCMSPVHKLYTKIYFKYSPAFNGAKP